MWQGRSLTGTLHSQPFVFFYCYFQFLFLFQFLEEEIHSEVAIRFFFSLGVPQTPTYTQFLYFKIYNIQSFQNAGYDDLLLLAFTYTEDGDTWIRISQLK